MKRILMVIFSLVFMLNLNLSTSYAISFSDLNPNGWAYGNIMFLAEQGIINGYTDGTYKPENEVTRGEFLKLIMVALYDGNQYFEINNFGYGHWASMYAIEAARGGYLMNGTDITGLNDPISRKEMVNILAKICIKNDIKILEEGALIKFSDVESLDDETKIYIDFVTANGLINGYTDGTFKADRTMTRAEVATVMTRFLNIKF